MNSDNHDTMVRILQGGRVIMVVMLIDYDLGHSLPSGPIVS